MSHSRNILFFLFLLLSGTTSAQNLPDFDNIPLSQGPDYKKAEPAALQAANYLLGKPFVEDDLNRLKALSFVLNWMSGTPDYSFTLDAVASRVSKKNSDILGLYMACLTKYALENKESAKDEKKVRLNAVTFLLDYCENPANNMKLTKELKKLSEAKAKGELEKALE